jgi:CRISPR/Cas system-associated endonuclease Cas3-HD
MTREEYMNLRDSRSVEASYTLLANYASEHDKELTREQFEVLISLPEIGKALITAVKYFDDKFEVIKLYDTNGKLILTQ